MVWLLRLGHRILFMRFRMHMPGDILGRYLGVFT